MREIMLGKNQKGLAIVEYVIVLAVVAALAAYVFTDSNRSLTNYLKLQSQQAIEYIKKI